MDEFAHYQRVADADEEGESRSHADFVNDALHIGPIPDETYSLDLSKLGSHFQNRLEYETTSVGGSSEDPVLLADQADIFDVRRPFNQAHGEHVFLPFLSELTFTYTEPTDCAFDENEFFRFDAFTESPASPDWTL